MENESLIRGLKCEMIAEVQSLMILKINDCKSVFTEAKTCQTVNFADLP